MAVRDQGRLLAGRYRLCSVIGQGGMGAVWRARDELLNRDVAVKEIIWPPQMGPAERETARRRAVREAQMAARLRHPNVVGVYDFVEEYGRPCIVMELVPFRSLRALVLKDGPLAPAEAARVGLGVLAGLRAAHQAGIVHRDVKPANILLGPEGRVVLTDFGIAKTDDSPALTDSGVLIGSPSYTAPERALGRRAGVAADLWALGALLYTAVEGRPPFERDGALASLTAVVESEPDPPARAGPMLEVINGLLRKDPEARLDAAGAERLLRRVVAEAGGREGAQPPEPAGPGAGEQSTPSGSRRFRVGAAAVALFAVAVITAGLVLITSRSPPSPHAAPRPAPTTPGTRPATTPASTGSSTGTRSGGSSAVPAGYYRFTNPTGFSIGVPVGWQISHVGHYVYVRDPANSGIFLLIDQSGQPKPNPLADWQQQAAAREGTYPGYHLIFLRAVRYPQAEKAADWEFTYDRNGIAVEVLNRNVLANVHHAYALYWSTPVSDWNAYYHYFVTFAATFRPAAP